MAGEEKTGSRIMIAQFMREGPDEGDPLHASRGAGQVFAEMQSGDRRGDVLEWTANFGWGVRLGIEGVKVAGTAVEPQDDAGLGLGLARRSFWGLFRAKPERAGERQAEWGERAQVQKIPARHTIAAPEGLGAEMHWDQRG